MREGLSNLKTEARGEENVGAGASAWWFQPRERFGGDGLGAGIELTSGPYSSVEEREGVRVLARCWNWAKQAENEGKGERKVFPFYFPTNFSNSFPNEFLNSNSFLQNHSSHKTNAPACMQQNISLTYI